MEQTPVIIIGMHRSGTSMLSRLLEKAGIFMGARKQGDNEALFFLKFNDWILKQTNATWDNPYNYTLAGDDFKDLMAKLANKYVSSIRRIEYLGFKRTLKYRSLKDLDFPWGWKDPRNTFTLDIWLKVFPNAKVIHIYRNPIDVAESLRRRNERIKQNFKWSLKKELKLLTTKGYLGYGDSVRIENIVEGIKLWREYVSHVFELEKKYDLDILHMKYEKFLEKPAENIQMILDKIGINLTKEKLESMVKNVNANRKYAFLSNKNLVIIYEDIKKDELLRKLGYDKLRG